MNIKNLPLYFYLLKLNKILLLPSLLLITIYLSHDVKSEGYLVDEATRLANECIKYRRMEICKLALKEVEISQVYAGGKSNYSCQTHLLGLQSELIMIILKEPNANALAIKMLENTSSACK